MRTHFVPLLLVAGLAGVAVAQPARDKPLTWFPVTDHPPPKPPASLAGPINIAPIVPPAFRLIAEPAVRKDIGLTDAQNAKADSIRNNMRVPFGGVQVGPFAFIPADVLREAVNHRIADFLATGLTKEQRLRLDQILFQLREKEFGPHLAFTMSARDLGLRPDQVDDARTLKALRVEEIAKTVTSGKRFEKVKLEVQATNGDTFEKMSEMLSRAQRERLKTLRGNAFEGKVDLAAVETKKETAGLRPIPTYPPQLFGVYDFEIRYLSSGAVRVELWITRDQMPPIDRALDDWEFKFSRLQETGRREFSVEQEAAYLHERSAKLLDTVLTPKQRQRFDELMAQRRLAIGGYEAVCGYPPVVAALKLTPVQLKKLKEGTSVEEVLTKAELDSLQKFLGKPFELSPYVLDPLLQRANEAKARGGNQAQAPVVVAQARDFLRLTNRLQLSAEQVKKLRELAEDEPKIRELIQKELSLDDTPPVVGAGRALTAVNAVTEHYQAAVEQQCWDVLDPPQQSLARKLFGRK